MIRVAIVSHDGRLVRVALFAVLAVEPVHGVDVVFFASVAPSE